MANQEDFQKPEVVPKSSFSKEFFERALWPIAAFSAAAAIVVGAISSWDNLADTYIERPILFGTIVALSSALIAWALIGRYKAQLSKKLLMLFRTVSTVVPISGYVLFVVWPNLCEFQGDCGPSDYTPFQSISELIIPSAYAANPGLVVAGVKVDAERSSFRMRRSPISIHGLTKNKSGLSFIYDRSLPKVFRSASCRGVYGETPIIDALPIWRKILVNRGKPHLAREIRDYAAYSRLIRNGGRKKFNIIRPTTGELKRLKRSDKVGFALMQKWMVDCVGVAEPVLIWTIQNRSNKELVLSSVDYLVSDVGQVMGKHDAVISPNTVQPHKLLHVRGVQNQPLSPQLRIAGGKTIAVRIHYRLSTPKPGFTWLLRAKFKTLDGDTATSEELKIFAAK